MSNSNPYQTKIYIRFITYIVFTLFILFFRIKKKLPKQVKNVKSPYILLCNHVGFWDPFIAGHFLPHFTHFVSSDAAFRNPFFRFFLTRLGTIPKKKNIRDTKVIRDIISVIKSGENVGIFPEAVRNWSGVTSPVNKSIVKLIKLVNVPVVICTLKGMNNFNPRWSKKLRRTKVVAEYKLLFTQSEIESLSTEEIHSEITKALFHDEVEYQRKKMNKILSKRKAEHINHALYVCPHCYAIDSFRAKANSFSCNKCNYSIHINEYGFYQRTDNGILYFDNIRDWYDWQQKWMFTHVCEKFESNFTGIIFEDTDSKIYHSKSGLDLKFSGIANVKLFIDRIEIDFSNRKLILNFNDLMTINPQVSEMLEIYYSGEPFRIIGGREGVSALKWEVAVNAIWKKLGQYHKLSSYIYTGN